MWIVGLLVYGFFYLLTFGWYLPNARRRRGTQAMIWFRSWFHPTLLAIALALIGISAYFFWLEADWLVLAPIGLVLLSWFYYVQWARYRINKLVRESMFIQVSLERLKRPQPEINRAILTQIFGAKEYLSEIASDFDIALFIKTQILSPYGYYDSDTDFEHILNNPTSVGQGQKIDALINYWRLRIEQTPAL